MPNETIGVDHLVIKSQPKAQPKPLRLHQIAVQVNDLVNENERITAINQTLIQQVKELREQLKKSV